MSSLFGIEASRAAQFAIAFAIILVLVALFGLVLRKLTGARLMMPNNDRNRSRQPRLGIVDIYDLDRQRQLVLLRRDNVEHLLLIGGLNDVVIETNIVRVAGARIPAAANEAGPERFEPAFEQAPRAPQVEPSGRPSIETQLAAQLGAFVRRPSEESDVDQELSAVGSLSAPMPAHPEPVLKPDAVTLSAPPTVQGLRTEARAAVFPNTPVAPEPVVRPEPAVRPEPVVRPEPRPSAAPPPFAMRPAPVPPTPPSPPPAPPVQPEIARAAPQPAPVDRQAPAAKPGPDAGVLSDMAKQLEEALKRPAAGPVPPQPAPGPAAPRAAIHEDVADEDELLEPARPHEEPVAPYEAFDEEEEENEPVEEPRPVAAEPQRPAVEPVRPVPPPPAQSMPPAPQAQAPAAPQPAQKAPDPFSVEEIEAEFARLLGRPLDPGKKG